MCNKSQFIFDGYEYKIENSQILASIGDPYWCDTYNNGNGKTISWSISFDTISKNDDLSPPNVDFDGIQIDVKNWHELVGYETKWKEALNTETGDRYGLIYIYDHQLISNGSVQIVSRKGTKFQIIASGQNEEGQRFTIDAPAEFIGINVQGSEADSDESIRERVKQQIDDLNLSSSPFKLNHKYDSGVKMGQSFYEPKTD